MTIHSRTVKSNGTPAWENAEIILHSEHNDEWVSFLLDYNGNVNDLNVKSSADIAVSKIGDHAVNDSTFLGTGTDPGDHFGTVKPTILTKEIETLRHRIKWNEGGTNLKARNAAGAMVTVGWTEPPIVGRNLLPNPGFELQTGAAGTAPDGWTLVGTPATAIIQAATGSEDDAGTDKRSFNIIGTAEGIKRVVAGLKADTKYRIGICWLRANGTLRLSTTGGLGAATDYGDLLIDDASSSSLSYENGVIKTNSSGGDITVNILAQTASAELNAFYVWMYEMADDAPIELPPIQLQTVTDSTQRAIATASPSIYTQMSLSQYIPGPGYYLKYEAEWSYRTFGQDIMFDPRIEMQIDSGGWSVKNQKGLAPLFPLVVDGHINTVNISYTVEDPIPGSNYQFRLSFTKGSVGADLLVNVLIDSVQSTSNASLLMRRY